MCLDMTAKRMSDEEREAVRAYCRTRYLETFGKPWEPGLQARLLHYPEPSKGRPREPRAELVLCLEEWNILGLPPAADGQSWMLTTWQMAIVSILAGNFPEGLGAAAKAVDVVRAEERRIRLTIKRYGIDVLSLGTDEEGFPTSGPLPFAHRGKDGDPSRRGARPLPGLVRDDGPPAEMCPMPPGYPKKSTPDDL